MNSTWNMAGIVTFEIHNNGSSACRSKEPTLPCQEVNSCLPVLRWPNLRLTIFWAQLSSPAKRVTAISHKKRQALWPVTGRSFHFLNIFFHIFRIFVRKYRLSSWDEDNSWVKRNRNNNADVDKESAVIGSEDESEEETEDKEESLDYSSKTGRRWVDSFITVWQAIMLIMSLVFLVFGMVLRLFFSDIVVGLVKNSPDYISYSKFVKFDHIPDKLEFGNLTDVTGQALMILSALYIICCILYLTYPLRKPNFTLPMAAIVSCAVVLAEVNFVHTHMSPFSDSKDRFQKELKRTTAKEYRVNSENTFSVTYDIIAIWGQCCGIEDQYDFRHVVLQHTYLDNGTNTLVTKGLQTPVTCCKPKIFEKGLKEVVECATKAEGIFQTGCYVKIYKWLKYYSDLYTIVVFVQLTDITIHILMYKKHLRYRAAI